MARVVPGGDCKSIELGEGGAVIHRQKDGAFHVPDRGAKQLADAVGGFVAGTCFRSENPEPTGPWCEHGKRPYFCEDCD